MPIFRSVSNQVVWRRQALIKMLHSVGHPESDNFQKTTQLDILRNLVHYLIFRLFISYHGGKKSGQTDGWTDTQGENIYTSNSLSRDIIKTSLIELTTLVHSLLYMSYHWSRDIMIRPLYGYKSSLV